MAHVFNILGQSVLPKVFAKLNSTGLTDLMNVKGETNTVGTGGGRIKSASTDVYTNIPVVFEPDNRGNKVTQGEQLVANQTYTLTFPSHTNAGVRYNIDPKSHRLVVQARTGTGTEPQKTFRILTIEDVQGNLFRAVCVKEN